MRYAVAVLLLSAGLALPRVEGRDTPIPGWFDLPVPGGAGTMAALGIPVEERALSLPILARAAQDADSRAALSPERMTQILAAVTVPSAGEVTEVESIVVPAPLDAETWRELLALKPDDDLFTRFLADKEALLLAAAIMSTDDTVRALLSRDRGLLRFLYRDGLGAFSVVARRLRVDGGRLVVPGGTGADQIWERLVGASPARPSDFLRALVSRDEGRLAWYFDTLGGMDEERLAAAWPSGSPSARREHANTLYESFRDSSPQWKLAEQPYRRHYPDPWTVIMLSELRNGKVAGPLAEPLSSLVKSTTTGTLRERREKVEAFFLGQRVFSNPARTELADIAMVLDSFGRYRALLLALERMEITDVRTWAAAVKAARHVTESANDRHESLAVFQAVVGLLERIRHLRTIDVATADRLIQSLADTVQRNDRVIQSIATWLKASFVPQLPPLERPDAWTGKTAYESILLQALGGPRERHKPSIEWEGLSYAVDVVAAEHERLRAVRARLPSPGLDAALDSGTPRELADALTALVYTSALGDPEGAVALSREIALRHDLGLDGTSIIRDQRPWGTPEERQGLGPWHVQGALIGLDLALSRLALRRLTDEQMPAEPALTLNDFGTLTRTVVAMVPFELADADRDELANAIARGRQRVTDAGGDIKKVDALARQVHVSAVTRQLLPWLASRQPEGVAEVFTLRDLMWLGRPTLSRKQLDRWGVAAEGLDGRRVTAMPPPAPWEDFAGRSDAGQVATQVPDLTLRLVEETARLKLPAVLIPSLLAFAVNDYWHDVRARFGDDWWRMTRQARALDSTRVEDYVAALTGNGPLRAR